MAGVVVPAASVSAAAAAAQPGAPGGGQLGIRLVDAPTDRRDDPRARVYVVDHVHQGEVVSRRIEVSNTTRGPLQVQTYAGAASLSGGAFVFGDGRAGNELTSWVAVSPASLTVPAGGTVSGRITITVPRGVPDGERYGVVWAQAASSGDGNVRSVSRVGVRIYLSVGEGREPTSDFTVDSLQAERRADGVPVVLAQVHNTGERALDMRGKLTFTNGPGGLAAGPYDATVGTTLAVGDTGPVAVVLAEAITGGPWTATLSMSAGGLERRVQGTLTFPDAAGASSAPVRPRSVPLYKDENALGLLATGLIGVLALVLVLVARFAFLQGTPLGARRRPVGRLGSTEQTSEGPS